MQKTEGSPIRRIGYQRWLRNLSVGLGNAPPSERIINALKNKVDDPSPLVREHVEWALREQQRKLETAEEISTDE